MAKGYHHLTRDKRCQIEILLKREDSLAEIARAVGVSESTISRERKRNSIVRKGKSTPEYIAKEAQRKSLRRRREVSSRPRKLTSAAEQIITEKLLLQWSPEQISGWLKLNLSTIAVSHETIYKMILKDKKKGGELYMQLRRYGRKYKKRSGTRSKHSAIPNRVDIDERPEIVALKQRLGDWEIDTIVGKFHKGAIVTMVDRVTKMVKIAYVERKTADNVAAAIISKLTPIKDFVLTLTADNGGEFARHESFAKTLEADVYFAKPYHSWERGLNEHTNGLLRQYFPKNIGLEDIKPERIEYVESLLNNRPRKVLNYRTPLEAFDELRRSYSLALAN